MLLLGEEAAVNARQISFCLIPEFVFRKARHISGIPIVFRHLAIKLSSMCPGLCVIGALAELKMGPIARNIFGARQAAERIVSSLQ